MPGDRPQAAHRALPETPTALRQRARLLREQAASLVADAERLESQADEAEDNEPDQRRAHNLLVHGLREEDLP